MSEELKNCPFCGGEATLCDYVSNDDKKWFYIVCGDCGVVTDHVSAEEIVVRNWNTRPEEDRLKAENERLFDRLKIALNQRDKFANQSCAFGILLHSISIADYGKELNALPKEKIILSGSAEKVC